MTVIFCQGCQSRIQVSPMNNDFVHNCADSPSTPDVLKTEDIVDIGPFTDFTGSGGKKPWEVNYAGVGNKLQGTRAGLLGAKTEDLNIRGNPIDIFRSRDRLFYSTIKDNNISIERK